MPIPKPGDGESKDDFVARCMGDDIMTKEYPDQKQRAAVCNTVWQEMKERAISESCQLLEKIEPTGKEWQVLLIRPGTSKNRNHYPAETLAKAAPLFESKKAFADHATETEKRARPERSIRDVVGWFDSVRAEAKGLVARFHILESADWLRTMLLDAYNRGRPDLVGFSIDAEGKVTARQHEGRRVRWVESIERVNSVDVVTEPAAGGELVRLVASHHDSKEEEVDLKELTLDKIKEARPDLLEGLMSKEEVEKKLKEAEEARVAEAAKKKAEEEAAEKVTLEEKVAAMERRQMLQETLAESKLPEITQAKIRKTYDGRTYSKEELTEAINAEREYLSKFEESGKVKGAGKSLIEAGDEEKDKWSKAMDGLFAQENVGDVKRFYSFHESYRLITGQAIEEAFSLRESSPQRLKESMDSTSWAEILGDSITRRMVAEYAQGPLTDWRKIVSDVVPVKDFRTQRRMRMGGYGNLPTVGQGDTYTALTSPGDEEATYSPTKRGGTEDLTFEMIRNDDVGAIRRIPVKLARAAGHTLYEFVFDFIKDNGNIYDATALFVAGHSNLGSTALAAAELLAAINAMRDQTVAGSSKTMGGINMPKFMLIPNELFRAAWELVTSAVKIVTNDNATTPNFFTQYGINLIVLDYWTDANNWYLVADPKNVPTIEIGFLDGREEPELFVQDQQTVGSVFTADKITYKIRHIYGGAVLDYRGFYGEVVA